MRPGCHEGPHSRLHLLEAMSGLRGNRGDEHQVKVLGTAMAAAQADLQSLIGQRPGGRLEPPLKLRHHRLHPCQPPHPQWLLQPRHHRRQRGELGVELRAPTELGEASQAPGATPGRVLRPAGLCAEADRALSDPESFKYVLDVEEIGVPGGQRQEPRIRITARLGELQRTLARPASIGAGEGIRRDHKLAQHLGLAQPVGVAEHGERVTAHPVDLFRQRRVCDAPQNDRGVRDQRAITGSTADVGSRLTRQPCRFHRTRAELASGQIQEKFGPNAVIARYERKQRQRFAVLERGVLIRQLVARPDRC